MTQENKMNDEALKALEWLHWAVSMKDQNTAEYKFIKSALTAQPPAPSVDGEVVEIVRNLHKEAVLCWKDTPPTSLSDSKWSGRIEALEEVLMLLESHKPQAVERVTEWQPIETAPRDGVYIITAGKSVPPHVGYYVCEAFAAEDGFFTDQGKMKNQPTHWMPLPKPPMIIVEGEK